MYILQPSNHLDLPSGSVQNYSELLIFHIHNNIYKMFTPISLHNKPLCHPGGRPEKQYGGHMYLLFQPSNHLDLPSGSVKND